MKVFLLAFFLVFAVFAMDFAKSETIITGKILGCDGKPLAMAHVSVYKRNDPIWIKAEPDGKFSITTTDDYCTELQFSGVDHESFKSVFFLNEDGSPLNIEVKLVPNQVPPKFDKILLVGNFNEFNTEENMVTMVKSDDNHYNAVIDWKGDSLLYQIIFDTGNQYSMRLINGQASQFYIEDEQGDYITGIKTNNSRTEISLDLSKFPVGSYSPDVSSKDTNIKNSIKLVKKIEDLNFESMMFYRKEYEKNYKNYKIMDMDSLKAKNKKIYLDSMELIIDKLKNENIRIYSIMYYYQIASFGQDIESVRQYIRKDYTKEILNKVRPTSDLWGRRYSSGFPIFAARVLGEFPDSKYLAEIIEKNSNAEVKTWLLLDIMRYASRLKDTVTIYKYYDYLLKKYPDSDVTGHAKNEFSRTKNIEPGKILPDFKFANMENPSDSISPVTFRGKYVLIDIWGTWCGPCVSEMPTLDSAWQKFKSKNIIFYSIAFDRSASVIKEFRKKWKMPWLHSFVDQGFESKASQIFEVKGVPTTILVGPDGKIVETSGLRSDELEKTLSRYLK